MRQPNAETHFDKLYDHHLLNALHSSVSSADEMADVRSVLFDGKNRSGHPLRPIPAEESCLSLLEGIDEPRKQMLHALMSVIMHSSNITARVLNAIQLTEEGISIVGHDAVSVDISLECQSAMAELLKLAQGAAGIELPVIKEQIIKLER